MEEFVISYSGRENAGVISKANTFDSTAWKRISTAAINIDPASTNFLNKIKLPWYQTLSLIREFMPLQRQVNFKFITDDSSREAIRKFVDELRATKAAREGSIQTITEDDLILKLKQFGFVKRDLRSFQIRDVLRLISLPNGANFSVPGSGKTTVTLAVHLLTTSEADKLLVICPKSAFAAWSEVIDQCIDVYHHYPYISKSFINLSGLEDHEIVKVFATNNRFFFINYEQFVNKRDTFSYIISTTPVHVVLDESHRMKAGELSQRGSALLSIANLPKRKDILSGTPMPQSQSDLQSQFDFLYPGSTLGQRIQKGELPGNVITGLYTRTTKIELGLPPVQRHFVQVPMSISQAALYGIVKSEVLRQLSSFKYGRGIDIFKARKSVMRLLQLCSNPVHALRSLSEDIFFQDHAIINAVLEDPISTKMQEVSKRVRLNAENNRKTVVWTIFTKNITDLEQLLAEFNPVSIYGEVKSGDFSDLSTREGRLKRFHVDKDCMVLIANPAAAGEGISLHEACHEAIYLDRSYVSTHYLQSIDRIHRLGLMPGTVTNVTILQSAPPSGLGSVDYSVSRRLARKIRALQQLLDDPDLHLIALDEESADEPIDYELEIDDVADLIEELEGNKPYNPSEGI